MKQTQRAKTRDVAFPFRMGAGFSGDVNRMHPAEVEAALIDPAHPPTAYGQFVLCSASNAGVRPIAAGDQSNTVALLPWGVTVRPYPMQQSTASNFGEATIGDATPPVTGVLDVLRSGLIMGKLNPAAAASAKGGAVYLWAAATTGSGATLHTIGGLETAYSAGNTVLLDPRYTYNGPPDSNGVVELSVNV